MANQSFDITTDQHLLLKAAVFPPEEAIEYWQKWKMYHKLSDSALLADKNAQTRVLDSIDRGSHRLLPLVYRNLEASNDLFIKRLRGLYRHSWMRNQQFLHKTREIANVLHAAGIETLLLKGMTMSLAYYGDMGVRYMNDIDLLVPHIKRDKALSILNKSNLKYNIKAFDYRMRDYNHGLHLYFKDGHNLDLHHHLLFSWRSKGDDLVFWENSKWIGTENDLPCKVLSSTHQFLHNLIHGNFPNDEPDLRWIADCYTIYTKSEIDWDEIFNLASSLRLNWPIRQGLNILIQDYRLILPDSIQQKFEGLVVEDKEEEYRKYLYNTWDVKKNIKKFYKLARYRYILYYKDYSQKPFAGWFTKMALNRALAGVHSMISPQIYK